MELEIRPEPEPEVRQAIARAVGDVRSVHQAYNSSWRRGKGLTLKGSDPYATARPRNKPGAARA